MENNLQTHLDKLPETLTRDLDKNLCVCNEVPRLKVIEAIINGADTLEAVRCKTYASDGNGCCKRQVQKLIDHLHPTVSEDI